MTRDIAPLLASERDAPKIAGAINSFVGSSLLEDLPYVCEQLECSHTLLHSIGPDPTVYLAVQQAVSHALYARTRATYCV